MKKGFTLVELIAVIVILSIIALISTPAVLSVIEETKINNYRNSMYGLLRAVEEDHTASGVMTTEYIIVDGVVEPDIDFTGDLSGSNGTITYDENEKTTLTIDNGTYCATKAPEKKQITVKKCP
ncbi:MAG TPA: prepilin-type N-terminal cleavage/methylation domain-containing protein [Candidatus Pelethosoma merdigallinarum]|nr:prepilin-type N-terminal cleavage/methylation domain-containing protein [Candidatus Pelethosoma merdigallinarum]